VPSVDKGSRFSGVRIGGRTGIGEAVGEGITVGVGWKELRSEQPVIDNKMTMLATMNKRFMFFP
jgi:hypothetical protein